MNIKCLICTVFMAATIVLASPIHAYADEVSTTITYSPQESENAVALTNDDNSDESIVGSIFGGGHALVALGIASGLIVVGGVIYFVRKKGTV